METGTSNAPVSEIDEDLGVWVSKLRERLARGELEDLSSFDLGYGTEILPACQAIRVMLADLDSLVSDEDVDPESLAHRQALLEDFRRLRATID
jgi:hypothetical protein